MQIQVHDQLIDPPALVAGIPNDDYHHGPGVSKSMLDILDRQSAYHLRHAMNEPREPTPAMLTGSVFHTLVLEPNTFDSTYREAKRFSGKGARANAAAWEQETREMGLISVKSETLETAHRMAGAVLADPFSRALLDSGQAEMSGYFKDPIENCLCRIRPDFLSDSMSICVDLKSTSDASPDAFSKSCDRFNYHVADAMYRFGLDLVGAPVGRYIFLVVENTPPFAVAKYELDEAAQQLGRTKFRELLARYALCLEAGVWPGYPDAVQEISLPSWAFKVKNA